MKKIVFSMMLALFVSPVMLMADNIGFVEMDRVFARTKMVREFETEFQKKRDEYQKIFKERQEKVEAEKKAGKSDADVQKLVSKLEEELKPKQEELSRTEAEFQQKLVLALTGASKVVAKEYGVDVVLDKRVVLSGGFDLTDFVVDRLNNGASTTPKDSASSKKSANKK